MDIDRFMARHQASWDRMDELVKRGRRSVRNLTPDELDEMLALYQSTSAHLSVVRTQFDDVTLSNRLSRSLGAARGLIYRKKAGTGTTVVRFFTETFPAAAWSCRRAMAVAALLMFGPALAMGVWLYQSGNTRDALISPSEQKVLAQHEFSQYYKSGAASEFATRVTTNNIKVAALGFAGGAAGGVIGAFILVSNGANVGVAGAVMHAHGRGAEFWGLIAPHGLLELTAICLASAAGLRIAWAMFVPGERTRGEAIAEEGLRSITIVLGTMVMFVFAGLTEAFVTPSGLPTWGRVGIGVALELCALTWMFGVGHNAAAMGLTGRLGEPSMADLRRAALSGDSALQPA